MDDCLEVEGLDLEIANPEDDQPIKRPTAEQQTRNVELLEKLPKYLMLISPLVPAYSLRLNKWCKSLRIRE